MGKTEPAGPGAQSRVVGQVRVARQFRVGKGAIGAIVARLPCRPAAPLHGETMFVQACLSSRAGRE
jgi:hypothetical protein